MWINGCVRAVASIADHRAPGVRADPDIERKSRGLAGSCFGEYCVIIRTGIARVMENCTYVRLAKNVAKICGTIGGVHGDEDETVFGTGELQQNPLCTTCCPYAYAVARAQPKAVESARCLVHLGEQLAVGPANGIRLRYKRNAVWKPTSRQCKGLVNGVAAERNFRAFAIAKHGLFQKVNESEILVLPLAVVNS